MHHTRPRRTQRGNVLFLILLAVVLFAALNYAVTSHMREGGKDGSGESEDVITSDFLQWLTHLDNAVMRMHMSGIAYEDISFRHDQFRLDGSIYSNSNNNTRCTTDLCRVFAPNGGGMSPPQFTKLGNPNPNVSGSHPAPGEINIIMADWPGAGTGLNDVVLYFYFIRESVCTALKSKLGQSAVPAFSGTWVSGLTPSGWDSPAYTFSSNKNVLYKSDTFVTNTTYAGTVNAHCYVMHLAIKR